MALRTAILCAASAGALMALAGTASAQNTATTPAPPPAATTPSPPADGAAQPGTGTVSEVVVTGVRASLQSAESIKRDATQVVDSIVAEDIGKFPDNAVSDALQRVTGVQVFRNAGETNSVVVRGLPNVITTLNGREIFTGSGRGFSFQDLPAEAVSRVDVYKSSSADLLEGGIAGLINIDLHRPFDFKGFEVAGTARAIHSDIADRTDPLAGLLVSNRWNTNWGEMGLLVDISYMKQHYDQPAAFDDVRNPITKSGQTYLAPNVVGALYNQGYRERPQINGAFQWRPNEHLELYADALFATFRDHHALDFWFSAPGAAESASNVTLFPASEPSGCQTIGGQQLCELNSGTFNNPYTASSTQAISQHSYDGQASIGGKWTQPGLKISTDLSYTESLFAEDIFIIDTPLPNQTLNAQTNVDGHVFWNLVNSSQNDPSAYTFNGLFQTWDRNHGSEIAYRLDGDKDLDFLIFKKASAGFRYAHRLAYASGGTQNSTPPPNAATPYQVYGNQYFEYSPNELQVAGVQPFLTGDLKYLFRNEDQLRTYYGLPAGLAPADPGREFDASEDSYAGYAQVGYGFNLGRFPVDGQAGVRVVSTDRSIAATVITNNNGVTSFSPIVADTNDMDVLPNFSARLHLTDKIQARFSFAQVASRPDFGQLNPGLSLAPPTVNRLGYGSGGNPNLQEIKSDSIDATLEYYFARTGLASVAYFHRDISGYIQTYSTDQIIGGQLYSISSPQSAGSGYLQGVEVAYQQFFDFLPGPFSGLGVQLNYTYIDGETEAPASAGGAAMTTPLGNVSKNNGNAVLIYEKYGASARLAYNYRGEFISAFNLPGAQLPNNQLFKPENHLDFSFAYDVTPQLTLTVDATNLTRNDLHEYVGAKALPQDIRLEERTFSAGIRFRY